MLLMTGCVKALIEIDVKNDGSGNIAYTIEVNNALLALSSFEEGLEIAKKDGYTISKDTNNKDKTIYLIEKSVDNVKKELKESTFLNNNGKNSLFNDLADGFNIKKGLFKDVYEINAVLDTTDAFDNSGFLSNASDAIEKRDKLLGQVKALEQIKIYIRIKLPAKQKITNASRIENYGMTTLWNLKFNDSNSIVLVAEKWNIRNILIIVIVSIIIISLVLKKFVIKAISKK